MGLQDGTSILYGSGFSAEDGDHDALLVKLDDTGAIATTWLFTGPGSVQYLGARWACRMAALWLVDCGPWMADMRL